MRFTRIITLAIAATLAIPALFATTGEISQPFTITISMPKETVKVGGELRVHVVLTNVSNQSLFIKRSPDPVQAELHYTVKVHDKKGSDVKETKYGQAVRKHELLIISDAAILLEPGEILEEDTVLSKLFDLTSPGEYEVQLSRPVSDDPKAENVKSNIITITVTEYGEGHDRDRDRDDKGDHDRDH